jgi:hypothetical protein
MTEDMKTPTKANLTLPVRLTDEELQERGERLAYAHQREDAIRVEKKSADDAWNDQLKAIEGDQRELARVISAGEEERSVECELLYMRDEKKVAYRRADTAAIAKVRDMTYDEQQMALADEYVELEASVRQAILDFERQMELEEDVQDDDEDEDPEDGEEVASE